LYPFFWSLIGAAKSNNGPLTQLHLMIMFSKRAAVSLDMALAVVFLIAIIAASGYWVYQFYYAGGAPQGPLTQVVQASILNGAGSNMSSPGFSPTTITLVIGVNNTITWTNNDSGPHTVTDVNGGFDSGNLNSGQKYTHTFSTAGTFSIKCNYHPWMHGTIIVKLGAS
jgi:plastocyanin